MAFTLPPKTRVQISPHLYYKKFPFKLELKIDRWAVGGSWDGWNAARGHMETIRKSLVKLLPADKSSYRTREEWFTTSYFFEDAVTLETFLVGNKKTLANKKLTTALYQMTEEQAEASKIDAKLEYRKQLYHGAYTFRLHMQGGDDQTLDALQAQFFTDEEIAAFEARIKEEQASAKRRWPNQRHMHKINRYGKWIKNDRARMQFGNGWQSTIVLTKDEDDAALARLMLPNNVKITKAVLAK